MYNTKYKDRNPQETIDIVKNLLFLIICHFCIPIFTPKPCLLLNFHISTQLPELPDLFISKKHSQPRVLFYVIIFKPSTVAGLTLAIGISRPDTLNEQRHKVRRLIYNE